MLRLVDDGVAYNIARSLIAGKCTLQKPYNVVVAHTDRH